MSHARLTHYSKRVGCEVPGVVAVLCVVRQVRAHLIITSCALQVLSMKYETSPGSQGRRAAVALVIPLSFFDVWSHSFSVGQTFLRSPVESNRLFLTHSCAHA